jgi:hypothetical protein
MSAAVVGARVAVRAGAGTGAGSVVVVVVVVPAADVEVGSSLSLTQQSLSSVEYLSNVLESEPMGLMVCRLD